MSLDVLDWKWNVSLYVFTLPSDMKWTRFDCFGVWKTIPHSSNKIIAGKTISHLEEEKKMSTYKFLKLFDQKPNKNILISHLCVCGDVSYPFLFFFVNFLWVMTYFKGLGGTWKHFKKRQLNACSKLLGNPVNSHFKILGWSKMIFVIGKTTCGNFIYLHRFFAFAINIPWGNLDEW